MKILSIDTASNICGVSILEENQLICNLDKNTIRTHSENLMPMIEKAFIQSNLNLKNIDLLVCDKGPGSFTGIRIGIATVKAFCDSLAIPCVGVSSLEALAYSIKKEGFIASLLDCKNDNCYFALYELKNSQYVEILKPSADTIENAIKLIQKNTSSSNQMITFVGDGVVVYKEQIFDKFEKDCILAPSQNNNLNSYYLGLAGLHKWQTNQLEDILPLYLKKPQAQRQLEEKLKDIEITPMTQTDLDEISSIFTSEFDEFWSVSTLKDELNSKNSNYLVAKFNQNIVGFAGIKVMVDETDIMNIAVRKDFRNQGIGSLLLRKLIALSKEKNSTCITLEVMEENYSAIHLYKNFGFKQVGIRKNYYQDKNGLIMIKNLT
ncbi:MAG: tRNA (adenosine(37)-N6)-threonylcarbamoyltransferase complex dimerization subunit type 1 TsaB [Clostridia bacterium]|nr:tRNA (adenosine(37)-N6)-threonylcarbamoyltransferase complex dimerization subunit type 1 TsaB [Clostridia bacterium]